MGQLESVRSPGKRHLLSPGIKLELRGIKLASHFRDEEEGTVQEKRINTT